MTVSLRPAGQADIGLLLGSMRGYYAHDRIVLDEPAARKALLGPMSDPGIGRVWLIEDSGRPAGYVIALAARVVREVGELLRRSESTDKRLATLAVDAEVRFRSAAERAAFSRDLTAAIADLVSRYHYEAAPGGRRPRLVVAAHPLPTSTPPEEKP